MALSPIMKYEILNLKTLLDLLVAGEKDFKHTKLVFGTTSSTIKSMK